MFVCLFINLQYQMWRLRSIMFHAKKWRTKTSLCKWQTINRKIFIFFAWIQILWRSVLSVAINIMQQRTLLSILIPADTNSSQLPAIDGQFNITIGQSCLLVKPNIKKSLKSYFDLMIPSSKHYSIENIIFVQKNKINK